jgi:hypothetical protein
MKQHDDFIERLAEGARRAALPADDAPPFGFTMRLLADMRPEVRTALLHRLQWASLGTATLLCAAALLWNWTAPQTDDLELFATRLALESLEQP